jgi:NADH:ubiquinone oxidoreductase subunit 5 (subunit L)/multisubunit Na+/H+ antiporter MnhA subunit
MAILPSVNSIGDLGPELCPPASFAGRLSPYFLPDYRKLEAYASVASRFTPIAERLTITAVFSAYFSRGMNVAWVFERTVEVAAWIALIVCWIAIGLTVYYFVRWCGTLQTDEVGWYLIRDAAKSAGAAVAFALALGGLACVDRFLFDAEK